MTYITKINIDESQYSTIETIKKLDLDGLVYNIGLDTSDANAIASDIKQGKTAYVNGQKITGSLAPHGPQTITPTTKNQSFGPGVYLNGQIIVLGSPNLIPANIKSGINIFGVIGNLNGDLKLLSCGGWNHNPGNATVLYWNGSTYITSVGVQNVTFSGTPIIGYASHTNGGGIFTVCGKSIAYNSGVNVITSFSNKTISWSTYGGSWAIIGTY